MAAWRTRGCDTATAAVQVRFGWSIHPGEFPNSVLNGQALDLFNLYRAVVSRGGFKMGNAINWKGEVRTAASSRASRRFTCFMPLHALHAAVSLRASRRRAVAMHELPVHDDWTAHAGAAVRSCCVTRCPQTSLQCSASAGRGGLLRR